MGFQQRQFEERPLLLMFSRGFKDIKKKTRSFQALKIYFKFHGDSRKSRTTAKPALRSHPELSSFSQEYTEYAGGRRGGGQLPEYF